MKPKLYGLRHAVPGQIGSPEWIAYLTNLDAQKQAFVKECDEFSKHEGAMCGKELERHVGEQFLTRWIIPGLPRFHVGYSEYACGDPDMLLHTRSYLAGCEEGFRAGYEAGFEAATAKLESLGLKRRAVTGSHKALKAYFENEVQEQLNMGELFEPYLFRRKETSK